MSAYNRLLVREQCDNCGTSIERAIQFKFGEVWQHDYSVGQKLTWGANNVGNPVESTVLVSGHPEPCPNCGHEPEWTYDLTVANDVIVSATRRAPGSEFSVYGHEPFVVAPSTE